MVTNMGKSLLNYDVAKDTDTIKVLKERLVTFRFYGI